jgi:hypothetical protein
MCGGVEVAVARIPDEDLYPYRHPYGDYTGQRPGYEFEWSPITPAIIAWQKAERELRAAIGDLNMAGQSKGFGLNGLAGLHALMMKSFEEFIEQLDYGVEAAGETVKVLEVAHRDYTASNDASLDEYLALTRMLDGVSAEYGRQQSAADDAERQADADAEEQLQIAMGNKKAAPKVMAPGPFTGPGSSSGKSGSGGGLI